MAITISWSKDGCSYTISCDCNKCSKAIYVHEGHCLEWRKANWKADDYAKKRQIIELERQKALLSKPRSKAKFAALARVGETLPARRLKAWYGPYAERVLTSGEKPCLHRLDKVAAKQDVFEVLIRLPDMDGFNKLRDAVYKTTVGELVDNAFDDIESLASEMRDWYDSMPEQFQNADKGYVVEDCANTLEGISRVEVPECLMTQELVYLPSIHFIGSRSARLSDAIDRLQAVVNHLEAIENHPKMDEIKSLLHELEVEVGNAEGIDFPGMY